MLRRSDTLDEGRSENESRIWKLRLRMQKSRMTRSKLFHVLYCCTRVRHTKNIFFNSPKKNPVTRAQVIWCMNSGTVSITDCVLYEPYRYCTTHSTSNAHKCCQDIQLSTDEISLRNNTSDKKPVIWIHQTWHHTQDMPPLCRRNGTRLNRLMLLSQIGKPRGFLIVFDS